MELTQESISILGLSSIRGLGLKTFYSLLNHFQSIEAVISADYKSLIAMGLKASVVKDINDFNSGIYSEKLKARIDQVGAWHSLSGNQVVSICDEHYPYRLKQTFQPPPILYLRGKLSAVSQPSVAIVGSRKASPSGMRYAQEFAKALSLSGINVISGLALGIDTAAHRGAIGAGGLTSAVLGTGIDVIYPRQNKCLAEEITENGLLMSEMPLGTMPLPANFPRRNRVVSGLSDGVLVVEAAEKSGSLITSKFALEQNRDVFSIPGPIDSPSSVGTNNLIKQGAQLVSTPEEIVASLSLQFEMKGELIGECATEPEIEMSLSAAENELYQLISYSTTSFDYLVESSNIEPAKLSQELMLLELKGAIASVAGGYQRLKQINSRAG